MISESMFNVWRVCVVFCHIDGKVDESEKEWMMEKINFIMFTQEQKDQLIQELSTPASLSDILPNITERVDRGNLVNYLRQLAHRDSNFCDREKQFVESMTDEIFTEMDPYTLELKLKDLAKNSSVETRQTDLTEHIIKTQGGI